MSVTHKQVIERALSNPEVKREYEALASEFELRKAIILLRRRMKVSQTDLARALGTKQAYISRVESGKAEMTLPYFARIVRALDTDIEITLKPKNGAAPIKAKINP